MAREEGALNKTLLKVGRCGYENGILTRMNGIQGIQRAVFLCAIHNHLLLQVGLICLEKECGEIPLPGKKANDLIELLQCIYPPTQPITGK